MTAPLHEVPYNSFRFACICKQGASWMIFLSNEREFMGPYGTSEPPPLLELPVEVSQAEALAFAHNYVRRGHTVYRCRYLSEDVYVWVDLGRKE